MSRLIETRQAFTPSKARFNARCLEWVGIDKCLESTGFLDGETVVDEECIRYNHVSLVIAKIGC